MGRIRNYVLAQRRTVSSAQVATDHIAGSARGEIEPEQVETR